MSRQEQPRLGMTNYLDSPGATTAIGIDPVDGLPRVTGMNKFQDSEAPKLTPTRFVCMKAEGRAQCKYYVRQLVPFESDKDHNDMERYCTRLRDESGELVSLKNTEVLACELRDPPDENSVRLLDEHDDKILASHKLAEQDSIFDPLAELESTT